MSHTNSTIYVDRTTTPNKGIDVYNDIAYVLGRSTGDVGQLCGDVDANGTPQNTIKIWAKYKPYRANTPITSSQGRINTQYGLSIETATELGSPTTSGSFLNRLMAGSMMWKHAAPRGLATYHEHYRVLDFDGYDHNAVCPIGDVVDRVVIDSQGDAQIQFDLLDNLSSGNLTLNDIVIGSTALSSFYLGVLLYKTSSNYHIVTSDAVLGSSDVSITLSNATSLKGTWRAYPFFSSVPIALDAQLTTGTYLSAGWVNYFDIQFILVSESVSVVAFGQWNSTYTQIDIEWHIYNKNSASVSVTPSIYLYKNTSGQEPVSEQSLTSITLSSQTVPGASGSTDGHISGTTTMNYTAGSDHASYFWWLGASVPGKVMTYNNVEEPDTPL